MSDASFPTPTGFSKIVLPSKLLALSLLAAACGKSPEGRLAGKWVGDRIDNVSADQVERATGWVKGTSLEFSGDKMTVTIPTEEPRKGTFKVAKAEGDKMVVAVSRSSGATADEATLTFLDEKTLKWDIGGTREIVLVRTQ